MTHGENMPGKSHVTKDEKAVMQQEVGSKGTNG
ncbi:hypothetical protein BH10ACI4_BH10ACI4_26220 [soil metagenome]